MAAARGPRRVQHAIAAWLAVLLATATAGGVSSVRAQTRDVSVTDALDLYEHGSPDVLDAVKHTGCGIIVELGRVGPKWANAKGPAASARRHLLMASFALEIARPRRCVGLVEWACNQLRPPNNQSVPLPAERLWQEAALAVIEAYGTYDQVQAHLWHLNTRFRNEPRALLARGWMLQGDWEAAPRELAAIPSASTFNFDRPRGSFSEAFLRSPRGGIDAIDMPAPVGVSRVGAPFRSPIFPVMPPPPPLPPDIAGSVWTKPNDWRDVGWRVIHAFERGFDSPPIAAEAHLRAGYLHLVARRYDVALRQFAAASTLTTDRDLLYLGDLFSGFAEDRAGRKDAAREAFTRALDRVPSSMSAAIWLAALLQEQGRLGEAQDLIDRTLTVTSPEPDPWPLFGQGDLRLWPSLIDRLHGALWPGSASRSR